MFIRFLKFSLACASLAGTTAFAAGYEKAVLWGGRTSGVAGIGSPYIQGGQALYFNPAGLVADKQGMNVDVNVSALQSQFKGPIDNTNAEKESEKKMLTPFGAFYGITTDDTMGFGFGVYASGGSQAKFNDLSFSTAQGTQTVETDLALIEAAAGFGYKLMPNLKVGVAYRVTMAEGNFSFLQRGASGSVANIKVTDLKGVNALGYRVGLQYDLGDATKIGLVYRSQVDLSVKGKIGGNVHSGLGVTVLDENDATAKTTFPQAVTLGATHKVGNFNLLGELVWTQYSKIEHVTLDGAITTASGTTTIAANAPDLEQHWHDQYSVKLATEFTGMAMPVRFGYVWTSQVTDDDFARASFTAPGIGHTVTLGTGYAVSERFALDGGVDYTIVKGEGNGTAAGGSGPGTDIRAGDYENTAYALHLGGSFTF